MRELKALLSRLKPTQPDDAITLQAVKGPATVGGCIGMMLFSLPFVGAGIAIILMGTGHIPVEGKNASDATIIGFGCFFAGAGAALLLHGLIQLPAGLRAKTTPPWLRRSCWKGRTVEELRKPSVMRCLIGTTIVVGFFTPFCMFFFGEGIEGGPWLFIGFMAIFFTVVLYGWIRALKYAPSTLRLAETPLRPAGLLEVELHCERPPTVPNGLTATVYYVEQYTVRTGSGKNSSTSTRHRSLGEYAVTIAPEDCPVGVLPTPLSLRFDLGDDPSRDTDWASKKPHFWLLRIHASTPGVDYRCDFLLPVFTEEAS